jgi:hypothetical protein
MIQGVWQLLTTTKAEFIICPGRKWRVKAMSKKVILTITTLVLVITLGGVGVSCGPSQPTQFETYTDEASGFSIDYPQGWHIDEHPNEECPELKVSIQEKKYTSNPVAICVYKYEMESSLETEVLLKAFAVGRMKVLPNEHADYTPVSTEELTINGMPAIKHIYTSVAHLAFHTAPYKCVEVYLVENGTGWILRFYCPEESFDSYESTWDTVINSFRLL